MVVDNDMRRVFTYSVLRDLPDRDLRDLGAELELSAEVLHGDRARLTLAIRRAMGAYAHVGTPAGWDRIEGGPEVTA